MAVFDASWWGVWWPWMLVWGITIGSMGTVVMITISHRRTHRRTTKPPTHGIIVYLDDERVMELYQSRCSPAVRQKVEKSTKSNRVAQLSANAPFIGAGGRHGVDHTEVSSTEYTVEPITAIGPVIDVLDKADEIVYVDLPKCEVTSNHALVQILDRAPGKRPKDIRLSNLGGYVLVSGRFHQTGETASTITLQAPYGDPNDSAEESQVHVKYAKSKRSGSTTTDPFEARCLGHVQKWDPQGHCLVLEPIALFLR